MNINTPNIKYINDIFHDLPSLGLWTPATGAEMNGCLMYHNGWSAPDRGHGHGIYIQNDTPAKLIKDCIIFNNFGWGIHAYTEGGKIDNLIFDGCVCFGAGSLYGATYNNILVGGLQIAHNITVKNCMTYGAGGVNIGYSAGADNVVLENNYFPGGITKVNCTNLIESGNYYGAAIGNQIFLRANDYDPNRANLTIYNQAEENTIDVDVSAVFGQTGTIKAHNVQDYFVDIQTLTITAGIITVDMQAANRTVATPVGWTAPVTTFPQFGAFVLEKQ